MIDIFHEIDHDAGRLRVSGEKFGFRPDAVCQLVELGVRAVHPSVDGTTCRTVGLIMLPEVAVEFLVAIGVVVQDDTAGGRD